LADNGGPTQTMLPNPTSPAIDAGVANGLTADQRGLARTVDQPSVVDGPASDGTDIGAAELGDVSIDGASLKGKKKQKVKGHKVVIKIKAGAAEDVHVIATGSVKLGKRRVSLKKAQADIGAGATKTLKVKPASKKGAKTILKALASGKKAKASLTGEFTDAAGNEQAVPTKVKLSGK
jgi:hypothetical protein